MFNIVREILALAGLGGMVLMISLISFTKMALGAVLTLIGAFFPSKQDDATTGQATIKFAKISAAIKGSLRYGVIVGGVLLIIGAVIDGTHDVRNGLSYSDYPIPVDNDYIGLTSRSKEQRINMLIKILREQKELCKKFPSSVRCKDQSLFELDNIDNQPFDQQSLEDVKKK